MATDRIKQTLRDEPTPVNYKGRRVGTYFKGHYVALPLAPDRPKQKRRRWWQWWKRRE